MQGADMITPKIDRLQEKASERSNPDLGLNLRPFLLRKLISKVRNAKGIPPQPVIKNGVACLHPMSMQKCSYKLLELAILVNQAANLFTVASLWPLEVVDEGFVALDDCSSQALGLDLSNLSLNLPSLASPRRKPKGKKVLRGKNSRSLRYSGSPDGRSKSHELNNELTREYMVGAGASDLESTPIAVFKVLRWSEVKQAKKVRLCCDLDIELAGSESFTTVVCSGISGRVLIRGMKVNISIVGENIAFKVVRIDDDRYGVGGQHSCGDREEYGLGPICLITKSTIVDIVPAEGCFNPNSHKNEEMLSNIGGLDLQIQQVKAIADEIFGVDKRDSQQRRPPLFRSCEGILINGPSGTGKTFIACALARYYGVNLELISCPELVGSVSHEALRSLESKFSRAARKSPSIVLLDELDTLAPRRDSPSLHDSQRKLTAALLTIMDGLEGSKFENVLVIGTSSRPDSIDPALRRPGRFDHEIETVVPSADARLQILKCLVRKAENESRLVARSRDLEAIASITFGYVGADLVSLWRETVGVALSRGETASILREDFERALKKILPSALREIAVEVPSTSWDDIGGKEGAKRRLQEAVEWPLHNRTKSLFALVGVAPPKGILLYGPPGCSKTLLARAVATESRANFISVKGAELLSKWVGESEKAVRRIFHRARQAAPCVIFFDEIDALATSRSFVAGASAQARVVAQLLSEMDGIDTCRENHVIVIAATNRPDCLDAAFLRPGRIDVQIYVGLPDASERLSILQVHTKEVPITDDVDLQLLARDACTSGYSGAEMAALVREAALSSMERDVRNASFVRKSDFAAALTKVKPRTPQNVMKYFDEYNERLQLKHFNSLKLSDI